jgi:ribonuclease BN (tRNA processing enzyme)
LYIMIALLILGAGGAVPTPDRGPAGYWLEVDGRTLLLDPGPGALVRLVASPHGPDGVDDIDTVLFTHLHPDHCCDLTALLFALRLKALRNERPLQLIGPRGLAGYHTRLGELYGDWIVPYRRTVEILEIGAGDVLAPGTVLGGWAPGALDGPALRAFAADHFEDRFSVENLGYALRDAAGRTLVFSGDAGPGGGLAAAAAGADLLLVECSMPDDHAIEGHMTPSRVAELCAAAAPARVVLTHIYPDTAALDLPRLAGAGHDAEVTAAVDGDYFLLGEDGP